MVTDPAPRRAVFVIQKLAGLSGGAERILIETAEAMVARGFDVRLVTFDQRPGPAAYGRLDLPIKTLFPGAATAMAKPPGPAAPRKSGAIGLLKAIPNVFPLTHVKWLASHGLFSHLLARDLRRYPADVVVAFMPPAIVAAVRATRRLRIPVVASTHNVLEYDFGDGPRWDQNPLYRSRARAALAMAERVTVLQPGFAEWFPAELRSRVVVMPNPVSRLSAPLPDAVRQPIVLGVGRLTTIKSWDTLIEAFAKAGPALAGWQLHIWGEGPERENLLALIDRLGLQGRVYLRGATPEIGAEYDRAGILAHPSRFEGFGLSVAEAMAHGLPVVAFQDCPGVNELVRNGADGLLIARGSPQEAADHMAAALARLACNPSLRADLAQQGAKITTRFDAQAIYDDWAAMLTDLAGKTGLPDLHLCNNYRQLLMALASVSGAGRRAVVVYLEDDLPLAPELRERLASACPLAELIFTRDSDQITAFARLPDWMPAILRRNLRPGPGLRISRPADWVPEILTGRRFATVYLYHAGFFLSKAAASLGDTVVLRESGLNNYAVLQVGPVKALLRLLAGLPPWRQVWGEEGWIDRIEVSDPPRLPAEIRQKARKLTFADLLGRPAPDAMRKIAAAFVNGAGLPVVDTAPAALLLTQPLALIGICSLAEQQQVYAPIVAHLAGLGYRVHLKPHPLDQSPQIAGAVALPAAFPIEAWAHVCDQKFDLAIALCSAALETGAHPFAKRSLQLLPVDHFNARGFAKWPALIAAALAQVPACR